MVRRAFISRFSPSRTDPEVLEAIFVQRHKLAEVWLERLRDSVLGGARHHLLAVAPRGCGKSHLVNLLVHRLRKDPAVAERVRIARLPEDETTPSFWKLLLRILRALNAEYGDEFPPPPRDQLDGAGVERRAAVLSDYLLNKLNGRTLLVVVENLDDVMRGLKSEGQKRWRAFLQENPIAATLATAQQLTEDLSGRDRPFFNFFQIEHLQPLSADEALELLQKLAQYSGNAELAAFLQTPAGRARIRAIRHLTGGSHRVFIILSEFATRQKLDDLVTAFEELLDELTPYYQERLRWLPDQQREIVEFLCRQAKTVQVKEIAAELFLSEQSAAAQLKALRDKGYVTSASVGRESRYELAEPLMRLCVEVKDSRREPIRLIVEFLRIWYDRAGVESQLECLREGAALERRYLDAALQACMSGTPSPVEAALNQALETARASGDSEEVIAVLIELAATADSSERCLSAASKLMALGHHLDALTACERAIELAPTFALAWIDKGMALSLLGRQAEALLACEHAIELEPESALAWLGKGAVLNTLCRDEEALLAHSRAIELDSECVPAWTNTGFTLSRLGRHRKALAAWERAIELEPNDAHAWSQKQYVLHNLGRHVEALTASERAVEIEPHSAFVRGNKALALLHLGQFAGALTAWEQVIALEPTLALAWGNKAVVLGFLGRNEEALIAWDRAIELNPTSPDIWATRAQVRLALGQIDQAVDDFTHALELSRQVPGAYEGLAHVHALKGNWTEVEHVLSLRFRLPSSFLNETESKNMAGLIATIFRTATDRQMWTHRVGSLASIAQQAHDERNQMMAQGRAEAPSPTESGAAPPNPLAMLGDALVRSLTNPAYAEVGADALDAWAEVWQTVAERHPDLSLAARLFGVGVRYLQTKDERVLLDLVLEERSILRDLFGLSDKS